MLTWTCPTCFHPQVWLQRLGLQWKTSQAWHPRGKRMGKRGKLINRETDGGKDGLNVDTRKVHVFVFFAFAVVVVVVVAAFAVVVVVVVAFAVVVVVVVAFAVVVVVVLNIYIYILYIYMFL